MRVHIATSREIGRKCIEWAREQGHELSDMESCDIFISVMYDKLLSEEFINSKEACFNFHPGILPQYRGSGSYSWAIINGDHSAGVTLHEIDKSIDHGRIIEIVTFPIGNDATAESLFKTAEEVIFGMFKNWFGHTLLRKCPVEVQDESRARTYFRKDLENARDLTKFVRAFHFPGKPNAYYINKKGEKIELEYDN